VSGDLLLNGLRVVRARIVQPYTGVPFYDLDLDPELIALAPTSGPAALVIGTPPDPVTTLTGVVDPLASGSFIATSRMRVVAGAGGWSQSVGAQHFHSDAGLLSTAIYSAVAATVLEKVADLIPTTFGTDYVLSAGPASRVFGEGVNWWVDPVTGLTSIGPRSPAIPDPSLEILDWDPILKLATVSCDALVSPGTPLVDIRIGESPVIVRDVEQTFGPDGSRALCWCSTNAASPLLAALRTMVREFSRSGYLCVRRYRVVSAGPDPNTWLLQAVDRGTLGQASPMPDAISYRAWTGQSGSTAKLLPSSEVLVTFVDGEPTQPVIVGYSTQALPLEATFDASVAAHFAPTAPVVDIGKLAASITMGPAPQPLATGPAAVTLAVAIGTFMVALQTYAVGIQPVADPGPPPGPLTGPLITAIGALEAACTAAGIALPTVVVKGT
jgi:hypothetical protein